jgi:hypothetical protein
MDIRADRQDRAVNKPLGTERAGVLHDRIAVQREFEDIVGLYKGRAQGARQQESARIAGMTQADVAVFIEHALPDQNTIRDGELVLGALQ